jgi:membrane protein required for colicin V production
VFLAIGVVLGAVLRGAVNEMVGARIGIADRLAGSGFAAIRIGLVAVLIVVIFDRIIPADVDPDFLRGSRLRPILSLAGQKGLKSLPPETTAFIDRLKKERGI